MLYEIGKETHAAEVIGAGLSYDTGVLGFADAINRTCDLRLRK
jgi:hypothetical protein